MSTNKFFRKVFSDDEALNRLQTNIEAAVATALKNPLLDGALVEDVKLEVGNNIVNHKLGRKYKGYIIVKQNVVANFYKVDNNFTDKHIVLNSSAQVTVSIWVF